MDTLLRYGLFAVFAALILAPLGLPIPEDVSLLVAGTLARTTDQWSFAEAWLVGYLGVTLGDCIVWTLGRKVGLQPTGWLGRLFGRRQIKRIVRFYKRFGDWTVLICRNFPGLRFPAFFFAGASGMRFRRFIALDGAGAVFTTTLWVSVGWWIGPRLQELLPTIEQIRWLLLGVGLTIAVTVIWRWFYPRQDAIPEDAVDALESLAPED